MEALVRLIEEGRLPTFVALWSQGAKNCHAIVDVLLQELEGLGLGGEWRAASGFSGVIQRDGTPIGLHSWIEAGDWMVEVSFGTVNPVLVMPKAVGREVWRLTDETGPLCRAEWLEMMRVRTGQE
jgi:hypothetical protein